MTHAITLRPGIPDDDNRDYLPESLKGSRIVVNENGNNSQPYPVGLQEHSGVVADGVTDTWYLYVPSSYDPAAAAPLVISMHGGMMTGWGQAIYTSWTLVAEREGFIVLFPDASRRRFWLIEVAESDREAATTPNPSGVYLNPAAPSVDENHDIALVLGLIERMKSEYNIDAGRIYMQGMSMGNVMTSQFARYFGHVLAGAAGSGGPTSLAHLFDADGAPINRGGPLAIWQTRLERDAVPPHYGGSARDVVRANRDYWLSVNGVTEPPEIAVAGEDNLAFYRGEHADVVFRDVRNRDHGQTFDDAELVWSYLFSGVRRGAHGEIVRLTPGLERRGDRNAVAVCLGSRQAWVDNARLALPSAPFLWQKLKYHGLSGGAEVRGEYVYVPLTFIADVFGATLEREADRAAATLTLSDGRVLQFARGSVGCVVDGRITSMLAEAVLRDGELHISMEWICEHVLGLRASRAEDVLYVTDHHSLLSRNMAHLLEDLLT
jgi:poly(3-hydroxybutyrate) depolymerase